MIVKYINYDIAADLFIEIMNRKFNSYNECLEFCKIMMYSFNGNNHLKHDNNKIQYLCNNDILIEYTKN